MQHNSIHWVTGVITITYSQQPHLTAQPGNVWNDIYITIEPRAINVTKYLQMYVGFNNLPAWYNKISPFVGDW